MSYLNWNSIDQRHWRSPGLLQGRILRSSCRKGDFASRWAVVWEEIPGPGQFRAVKTQEGHGPRDKPAHSR